MNVAAGDLLVVDETARTLKDTKKYLSECGYSVRTAATAKECLERIDERVPALAILRCEKPSAKLSQLVRQIKRNAPRLQVLLVAPANPADMLIDALKNGADDHICSPIADPELLLRAVQRNLSHEERLAEMRRVEARLAEQNRKLTESLRDLERDQQTGLQVQRSMMPESPFEVEGIRFVHQVIPSLILSGDFIDYFQLPDERVLFYIADVSGHGASSAFVTVLLKNLSRRLAKDFSSLALADTSAILEWLNGELMESALDKHVTMFLGIVDRREGSLQYSNAAHFPGAILSCCGHTEYLEVGGLPLGLYKRVDYEVRSRRLPAQFTLVLFSDGVFEVMQEETLQAKEDRLLQLVEGGSKAVDSLSRELGLDHVDNVPDDIALFTVTGSGA